ncbi:MAG: ATP-grasp domain-containing protein [Desulfobacterales bacterium]|nr:MAG: ATP-grasp domain-containing protein [Desulfobacterales bacterium]
MAIRKPFNALITSVSGKVPLVREVRKALEKFAPGSRIIGADRNPDCLGRYFVDMFWEMPPLEDLHAEDVKNYCGEHQIAAIIPTRDGELEFFARSKPLLEANAIFVMTSPLDGVRICLDKLLFYETFRDHPKVNAIPTATEPGHCNCARWVVKERFGAGSRGIHLNLAADEAQAAAGQLGHPVYQPYIDGREFSIDLYIDKAGEPVGSIARSRDRIVDGESQVTTTVAMPRVEEVCTAAAGALGLTSHLVFQAIVDPAENIHVVECNCRFGGGSSLSVAAGLDSFYWFFRESAGVDLAQITFNRSSHQLRQVRYPEDRIFNIRS